MSPGGRDPGKHATPSRGLFLAPWAAMLASAAALAGLGVLAVPAPPPADGPTPPLAAAIAVLGLASGFGTLLLDRLLLAPERIAQRLPAPDPQLALRYLLAGHLALGSVSQLPAILGFAHLLLGGSLQVHLALCALSLVDLALMMPTAARVHGRAQEAVALRGLAYTTADS